MMMMSAGPLGTKPEKLLLLISFSLTGKRWERKKKCLAAVAEKRTAAAAALMALVRRKFLYFYYYFCSHFIIERRGHGDGRETGDNGSASSPRPAYYNINRIDIRHELKSPRGGRPLRWGVRY
jgi:hypothetical protein